MPQTAKPWYYSKTLWLQILTGVASVVSAFCPPVAAFLAAHPATILTTLGVVNAGLRISTKGSVQLKAD